jgi:hypothetical protein
MKKLLPAFICAALTFTISGFLPGCFTDPYSVGTPDSLRSMFSLAWDMVDANYASFINRPDVDWDAVFAEWEGQAEGAGNLDELVDVIVGMLGVFEDRQLMLRRGSSTLLRYDPGYFENFDQEVWLQYMDDWNCAVYDTLRGYAIGYAGQDSLFGYIGMPRLSEWFIWQEFLGNTTAVRECSGVILDLRACGGNSNYMNAYHSSGRFIDTVEPAFYRQFRKGPERCDMEDAKLVWTGKQGAWQFTVPVVVLTGRGTDGAGEIVALFVRTQEHVTLMGDETSGSPGIGVAQTLVAQFPSLLLYTPRFVVYDSDMNPVTAVTPDIAVPVSPADFAAGVDPVLDAAVQYLLSM